MPNVGPSTAFTKTPLPSQYAAVPVSSQPNSDINLQYNSIVSTLKELWACIEGGPSGTDINNTTLKDYSVAANLGILPRLVAIEQQGKIQDSAYLQLGTNLGAGNRGVRFTLGSVNIYGELVYDNDAGGIFKFRNQLGGLVRVQVGTPSAASDAVTKSYVDGLLGGGVLKKHCDVAGPVRIDNSTFSIAYAYAADSTGNLFIAKSTSTTISKATTGVNSVCSSNTSLGISGTISVSASAAGITGVGTSFTTDFIAGDWIVTAGGQARKILSITNNTSMTATSNFSSTESTVAYSRGGVSETLASQGILYLVSDAAGLNPGFMISTRNSLGGDTVVDFPRIQKTGTVAVANGSPDVNGTGTAFLTDFAVGQTLCIINSGTIYSSTITEVVSNTLLRVSGNWGTSFSGASCSVLQNRYRQLPFAFLLDGSGNQIDYEVGGFPWNTVIEFRGYDGGSRYSMASSITSTSAASVTVTGTYAPKLTGRIGVMTYANMVSQTVLPNYFYVASSSALLGSQVTLMTMIQQYNSGSNFTIITNSRQDELALDTNGAIWYKSATTNVSGGIAITRAYLTGWKG